MSIDVDLQTVEIGEDVVFVVAVTREASARARLAGQLSGDAILLMVPDYPTAVGALESGLLTRPAEDRPAAATVTSLGDLAVDRLRHEVTWSGIPLPLTRLEQGILTCLAEIPARVWSHEHLYRAVWREAWLGDPTAIHATVKRLRRKLREAGVPAVLESVRGVGFRLRQDAHLGAR